MARVHDPRCRVTDIQTITSFLYQEADCLDRADLDSWFELYTDDAIYWMPVSAQQTDPHSHISLFYDDRVMMEIRRRNFGRPRGFHGISGSLLTYHRKRARG